jgi:nucleotide-binding universal stress UspA family protein
MFKKAVVGLDLSPAEKPMMDCLSDLQRWGIEEIILVHVICVGYAQGAGFGHEDDYRVWLNERAGPLRDAGLTISVQVRDSGVVADELLTIASEESADLLVIGSRSHNFVHDIFLGSVARGVLHKASLPVLLERIEPTAAGTEFVCAAVCREKLTTLLLATDFSAHARRAEAAALALVMFADSAHFLSVIESPDAPSTASSDVEWARAALEDLKEKAGGKAEQVEVIVERGEAAEVIVRVAEDTDTTLIIVGKHGGGWLPERLIGSVADSVCHAAKRPVLMMPDK